VTLSVSRSDATPSGITSPARTESVRAERFSSVMVTSARTSLVSRTRAGALAPSAATRCRLSSASTTLAAKQTARIPAQGSASPGTMPARVAAGKTTSAAASRMRDPGTIIAALAPRAEFDPGLRPCARPPAPIRAQQQTVFEGRRCHGAHIVGADEIAPGKSGPRAAARQQRLCGARPGAHQNAIVGARAPHRFHHVLHQLIAHLHQCKAARRSASPPVGKALVDFAAPQHRLRRAFIETAASQVQFLFALRPGHRNLEHEAVFLRLRQWIGAFRFDGILGGENGEVRR
jgi:hypothetical protein